MKYFYLIIAIGLYNISFAQNDGDLDTSFGTNGYVTVTLDSRGNDTLKGLYVLNDNKIIGVGTSYHPSTGNQDGNYDFGLCKLNSNGSLDTSFGTNGIDLSANLNDGTVTSSCLQQDGKIIICGSSGNFGSARFTMTRHNIDGSLDTSFNLTGKLIINSPKSIPSSVKVQNDGKIIILANRYGNTGGLRIVKLNTDGSFDTSFGNNGILDENISSSDKRYHYGTLKIQSDGKYLIGGSFHNPNITYNSRDLFLLRLNTDGTFDNSFGTNGLFELNVYNADGFGDIIVLDDNSIFLVGSSDLQYDTSIFYEFAMIKITPNGILDTNFATNGILFNSLINENDSEDEYISDIILGDDGNLYLCGSYRTTYSYTSFKGFVVSMDINGVLNPTFANNGILLLQSRINKPSKIQFDNNNHLIVGGTDTYSDDDFRFAKIFSQLSLNVNQIKSNNDFYIYPNPIDEIVTIKFQLANQNFNIELFDVSGKLIKSFNNTILNENKEIILSFLDIKKGIYFLKINTNKYTKSIKVFKN